MSDTFEINKGSTLRRGITWPNGSGGAANLTGYTVDLTDVSSGLVAAGMTATFTNAAAGQIELLLTDEGSATLALGRVHTFRIRLTQPNGDAITTNLLWINLQ